ncbi:MAG: electron transport protein SCO1/SenC [Gammaproteobacteria bacterium]|nr:electron transport protein SCO1/SenC [Gammaproteobacteria bacterium]
MSKVLTLLVASLVTFGLLHEARSAGMTVAATRLEQLPAAWHDDQGNAFDVHGLLGHNIAVTMAYASCHRICPLTMQHLQKLQRDFDARGIAAEFLVIGYDPERDDAAAWHQYRQTRHLTRSNWHFLVGKRTAVEQTARQLGFEFWRYDEHVMHDSRIVMFDARGNLLAPERPAWRDRG